MKKLLMSLSIVAAVSAAGVTYLYGCGYGECGGGSVKCCTTSNGDTYWAKGQAAIAE